MTDSKKKFQVGDRVAVYGYVHNEHTDKHEFQLVLHGEIIEVTAVDSVRVQNTYGTYDAHPKQCRLLKPKERIEFWANIYPNQIFLRMHGSREIADQEAHHDRVRCVRLVEARETK